MRLTLSNAPRLVVLATAIFLAVGIAAALVSYRSEDMALVQVFFAYAGALFLVGCSFVQFRFSFECWRNFSHGDLLRPAWLLIALSAFSQLAGGLLTHILAGGSHLNPVLLLPEASRPALMQAAGQYGELFNPLYMLFLVLGLFYVLKACRQSGILGRFRAIDVILFGAIAAYTAGFFATDVFSPHRGAPQTAAQTVLNWTSDPLLCILLFQAILIRRSVANMGWGLIARCWLCFTVAIFATSVGDIGLWAWSRGYLSEPLQIASWYVWFLASAAFALGPCYQLQAMLHATASVRGSEVPAPVESV